ncbi:MAG: hypothetical protein AB8G26_03485 [Ilumatobacter sp.]
MTRKFPVHQLALPLVAALAFAACGSDDPAFEELPAPSDTDASVGDEPVDEPSGDEADAPVDDATMVVIGTGNMGGTPVDPQPHSIDAIAIMESFPEQLAVTFTGADPNCTAADATASTNGDIVLVELEVGITEDALTRSCLAGEFEHTISIPLDEGLNGRDVVAAEVG